MINYLDIDLKAAVSELVKNDYGQERGGDVLFLYNYVKTKEGEKGLAKVIYELEEAGYEIPDFKNINEMDWLPSSLPTAFMLAMAKALDWRENDVIELGKSTISMHSLVKIFVRYFASVRKTFEMAARTWQKHYTFGEIEIVSLDEKKKEVMVRISKFKKHPITCLYLQGLFSKIIEVATGSGQVVSKETKCEFRGDDYHEIILNW